MKPRCEYNRKHSREILTNANVIWQSYNNDLHWKIGLIDFWPTSLKWIDTEEMYKGEGVEKLIEYLVTKNTSKAYTSKGIQMLTVQQIAKIFIKNADKSLMEKCEFLHKEIYG